MKCCAAFPPFALAILGACLAACGSDEEVGDSTDATSTGGSRTRHTVGQQTQGGQATDTGPKSNSGGAGNSGPILANGSANTYGGAPSGGTFANAGSVTSVGGNQVASFGATSVMVTPDNTTASGNAGVANTTTNTGNAGVGNRSATTGNAGSGSTIGASDSAFTACTAALKAKCAYDEPENACSSLMTPSIPLTDGTTWGNIELKQGPYGSYVEWNEGAGFANSENVLETTCAIAASSFGEPQSVTQDVLDLRGQDLKLYTVFRPACMKNGEKYPVITWGNGTCGQSGSYGAFLATVASYGFVVVAANSRWTDQGNKEMLRALDFAEKSNEDPSSIFYRRLDFSKVGAMGHSQGGSATVHAATDARIKAVILWNGGTNASKPFLAVSGDRDIGGRSASSLASAVEGATQTGAWLYYHKVLETGGDMTGHLTLMEQPERVTAPTVAWWKYMLNGDTEAKTMFVGRDCGLCNKKDDYEYGQHNLP